MSKYVPWIRAIIANVTGPTVITPVSSEAPLSLKLGTYALKVFSLHKLYKSQ